MFKALNDNSVPGLVIDLRQNGGGRGFLADQMAAYFFNDKLDLGNSAEYDPSIGKFYFDPNTEEHFILPPENMRYNGKIAVLIGPDCASACEFFAYDMTLQSRAAIVGEYHTAGLGGGVDDVKMPDNVTVRITIAQAVDANGNVHIEGKGVQPTIQVPLTEQNLTSTGDPVMDAALNALGQ
jgi:C-terminal processing protease CtpA/Prc